MEGTYKIDLHMHTAVSDGTDTPAELLEKVRESGLSVFSVTDHDAVKGCRELRGSLREGDPRFICGAEFSCRDEQGKYHILGYGFDPDHDAMLALIEHSHGLRMKKVMARLDFLRTEYGFTFSDADIESLLLLDNPGKPHIGNLMVRYGYAGTKESAIKDYIDRIRFRSEYVRPEEAIKSILAGGGIPVLAHPFYGSGDELILGDAMEDRLRRLTEFGIRGIEAYYSGFTAKLTAAALGFAERYGLYVTAGSDYHGSNKLVKICENGFDGQQGYPDALRRFLETVRYENN